MAIGGARRQLERLFGSGSVAGLTEGQLLERFVSCRDDAAFEALVIRHGPMVLSVCRRMLRDPNDVDDAFQATFLVLVRKAGSLRRRDLVGNWLYGVAFRVASRARSTAARRMRAETPTAEVESLALARAGDTPGVSVDPDPSLHEELHRLPEKYRAPVVLCYLEGLTHAEAADRLSWPVGTVKGRLSRARDLLRSRLARRGVTLALAASAVEHLAREAPAAVPVRLVTPLLKAATHAAAGTSLAGLISAPAVILSEGVIHAMSLTQIKSLIAMAAVAGTLVGGGAYAYQGVAQKAGGPKGKTSAAAVDSGRPTGSTESEVPKNAETYNFLDRDTFLNAKGVEGAQRDFFDKFLRDRKQWDFDTVDRLFHWSRAIKEAESYLTENPENAQSAMTDHRDRMIRVLDTLRKFPIRDKGRALDAARRDLEQAESELHGQPTAHGTSLPTPPPATPIPQPPSPPAALPALPVTAAKTATSPKAPSPARGGGGAASSAATSSTGSVMMGGMGGMGGGMGMSPGEARQRESEYRVAISEIAPKLAEKDGSPKTKAILSKLDEVVAMNFPHQTPLEEVLKFIKSATQKGNDPGIPIYLDPVGLQGAGETLTSTVALDLDGVPLKTALRLALKQLGLAYCVKDGLLIISDPEGIVQELMETPGVAGSPEAQKAQMVMPGMGGGFR